MAQTKPTLGERLMESLRFWAVVAVICAVVGLLSYTVGKRYVGSQLHEMEVKDGAPEISPVDDDVVLPGEGDESPPEKPIIVMREREPTARERREVERELAEGEPQDGAELHAQEEAEAEEEEEPAPPDEEESTAAEPVGEGGDFVVSAGSFTSEDNAQTQVAKLVGMGYHPYLSRVERDGVTFSRVNVGRYPSRNQAQEVADELRAKGFDAAVYSG